MLHQHSRIKNLSTIGTTSYKQMAVRYIQLVHQSYISASKITWLQTRPSSRWWTMVLKVMYLYLTFSTWMYMATRVLVTFCKVCLLWWDVLYVLIIRDCVTDWTGENVYLLTQPPNDVVVKDYVIWKGRKYVMKTEDILVCVMFDWCMTELFNLIGSQIK